MILTLSICSPFDLLAMETANAMLQSTEKRTATSPRIQKEPEDGLFHQNFD